MLVSVWSFRSMISTVVSVHAGTASLTGAATVGLVVLLVARELAASGETDFLKVFCRNLMVFAAPLLVVFASIVVVACLRIIS